VTASSTSRHLFPEPLLSVEVLGTTRRRWESDNGAAPIGRIEAEDRDLGSRGVAHDRGWRGDWVLICAVRSRGQPSSSGVPFHHGQCSDGTIGAGHHPHDHHALEPCRRTSQHRRPTHPRFPRDAGSPAQWARRKVSSSPPPCKRSRRLRPGPPPEPTGSCLRPDAAVRTSGGRCVPDLSSFPGPRTADTHGIRGATLRRLTSPASVRPLPSGVPRLKDSFRTQHIAGRAPLAHHLPTSGS